MRSRALIAIGLAALAGLSLAAGPGAASAPAAAAHAPAASKQATPPKPVALIDINSASRAQLKTLPGISEAQANRIVAGRPYLSKADLATHNVIPTGIYLSLKNRIIAKQATKTKRKT
jgi:competence protein ComEA